MDLAVYLRDNKILPEATITEITNAHLVKKFTFFEELLKNGEKYGVKENDLLQWTVAAGGPGFEIISTTKGLKMDSADYDKIGGVQKAIHLQIMFVRRRKKAMCVVTKRPDDPGLIVALNKAFGPGTYTFGICPNGIFQSIYQLDVEPLYIESRANSLNDTVMANTRTEERVKDSEARQIYNHIITLGISRGASDIHLIPCDKECRILYRIDGTYYQLMRIPNVISDRVTNLLTVDGHVANKSPDVPLDGKIHYIPPGQTEKEARDLRFSIMPTRRGRDTNIRFLNNILYTFAGLGMAEHNVKAYEHILSMPQGLIMQVGPTGSGKSTTLYAGLNFVHDNSSRNIITVEDPVEIMMEGITQVDVKEESGLTFARVSRQFLRHDVDIGVIGEIRDEEGAIEAVRAATTGHLVISSLHTNDSLGVIERLIRLGIDPYTLSEVLVAVMGQRLIRRLCPKCKEAYVAKWSDPEMEMFGCPDKEGTVTLYRSVGCEACNNLGYKGRVAVNEILVVSRDLRDMIQRHVTRKEMEKQLESEGFHTMFKDALEKVLEGVTSVDELLPMYNDTLAYK